MVITAFMCYVLLSIIPGKQLEECYLILHIERTSPSPLPEDHHGIKLMTRDKSIRKIHKTLPYCNLPL